MRTIFTLTTLVALAFSIGCGGSSQLNSNSDAVIRIIRTDTSQDLMQYELYVTKNGSNVLNVNNPEGFISTQNMPTWCNEYQANRMSRQLSLGFRTVNLDTPYYAWIKAPITSHGTEQFNIQIDMGANSGQVKLINVTTNATERLMLVRIERNDATY